MPAPDIMQHLEQNPTHHGQNARRRGKLFTAKILAGAALMLLSAGAARAATLDWDSSAAAWANGTLSNTYKNVGGSGVDMSIVITTGGSLLWLNDTPATTKTATGGLSPAQKSLTLSLDFANTSSYADVSFIFSQPVRNVSFNLYDVDRGDSQYFFWYTFQDEVSGLQGSTGDGTWFDPTSLTTGSAVTQVNGNTVRGTGVSGETNNAGNVGVTFNQDLGQIKFRYEAGPNAWFNPAQELIALSDISFFTAVPEPSTVIGGVLCSLFAVGLSWRRWKYEDPKSAA